MGKFDGALICTDLDGTLFRNDKTISDENIRAIEYFKSQGGLFTFITGRTPCFVTDVCDAVRPNVPFGCVNGGGIYDYTGGKYLWTQPLNPTALDMVEYIEREIPTIGIQMYTYDHVYFSRENSAMAEFRRLTSLPNLVRHYRDIDEPIAKIVFGDESDGVISRVSELLRSHPLAEGFDFIRSERTLFEILPKGVSKGDVLKKIVSILNIDPDMTVAVGDYDNDVLMLREAKVGVAVANASAGAKAAADIVTVSNEEHAIARIIGDIEAGNIRLR